MFKIDTLHITFQLCPREVDLQIKDLHDLCSIVPAPGLRPFASNVFNDKVYLEQCKPLHSYAYGYAIVSKAWIEDTQTFKTVLCGSIFYGGNSNRPFLQFNGEGCKLLDFENLAVVVEQMHKVRITRCDIAVDDVEGKHGTMLDVVEAYKKRQFTRRGNQPSISQVGDWISDTAPKGRTLYIGARTGTAMMRIYEKGKELGISVSPWIRYELELKAVDYVIPTSILTTPERFFLSLNSFNTRFKPDFEHAKLVKKQKLVDLLEGEALWKHRVKYAKMQAGTVLFEQLAREGGDIGSLVLFAKSSKIKVDRLDKVVSMFDNEQIKE